MRRDTSNTLEQVTIWWQYLFHFFFFCKLCHFCYHVNSTRFKSNEKKKFSSITICIRYVFFCFRKKRIFVYFVQFFSVFPSFLCNIFEVQIALKMASDTSDSYFYYCAYQRKINFQNAQGYDDFFIDNKKNFDVKIFNRKNLL